MTALYYTPEIWRQKASSDLQRLKQEGRLKNARWMSHPPRTYWGMWVVLGDGEVLGAGRTREEAVLASRQSRKKAYTLQLAPIGPDGSLRVVLDR